MHWLDGFWMIAPSFSPARFQLQWMDILAPIGIGGRLASRISRVFKSSRVAAAS
jgi:hypothetical protein